jgi:glutathione synthase/RimK-type ligase-like ATP-grasp enzyme
MRVAFVTWSGGPDLSADDRLAADACADQHIHIEAVPWDIARDWTRYDAIVIRSTWNYHLQPTAFTTWIDRCENAGCRLWNPPAVLRWNLDKRYLLQLEAAGLLVPETIVVPQGSTVKLRDLLRAQGWTDAVVKPVVSASAFQTFRAVDDEGHDNEQAFTEAVASRDMLVQQFVPEIIDGESSLMFFGRRFSHAVKKVPADREFRVQEEFGGQVASYMPDAETLRTCETALSHVPGPTLYARIDGVATARGFEVIEVEVIEPSLFLRHDPAAARRFADQIQVAGPICR